METDCFIFSDGSEFTFDNDTCIIYLPSIVGVSNLFQELAETLSFPSYFGNNWNAVNDCLNDFSWFQEKRIVLIHKSLPKLNKSDMDIYLDILKDCVNSWAGDENHEFIVVFPMNCKNSIK